MDETFPDRPEKPLLMPLIARSGRVYFQAASPKPGRLTAFFRRYSNRQAVKRQVANPEVFCCIMARTGPKRRQQQLRRRHPLVGPTHCTAADQTRFDAPWPRLRSAARYRTLL